MSEITAITVHSPVPRVPPTGDHRPRDIDLYAEGNSFADWDASDDSIRDLFGEDGFSFRDLIDIVNPLHHLPVIGTLYRAISGDELSPGSRVIGGTLFGGIGGFVTALVNAVVENETGSDIGDKALAFFQGSEPPHPTIAAAEPTPATDATAPAPELLATAHPHRKTIPIFAGPPRTLAGASGNFAAPAPTAAGTESPTEALIRARAAVPTPRLSGVAGLPPTRVTVPASPMPQPAPPVTLAAATPPADLPATAGATAVPAPPREVAALMRDALDKYEALMKQRTGPSISGDY